MSVHTSAAQPSHTPQASSRTQVLQLQGKLAQLRHSTNRPDSSCTWLECKCACIHPSRHALRDFQAPNKMPRDDTDSYSPWLHHWLGPSFDSRLHTLIHVQKRTQELNLQQQGAPVPSAPIPNGRFSRDSELLQRYAKRNKASKRRKK